MTNEILHLGLDSFVNIGAISLGRVGVIRGPGENHRM